MTVSFRIWFPSSSLSLLSSSFFSYPHLSVIFPLCLIVCLSVSTTTGRPVMFWPSAGNTDGQVIPDSVTFPTDLRLICRHSVRLHLSTLGLPWAGSTCCTIPRCTASQHSVYRSRTGSLVSVEGGTYNPLPSWTSLKWHSTPLEQQLRVYLAYFFPHAGWCIPDLIYLSSVLCEGERVISRPPCCWLTALLGVEGSLRSGVGQEKLVERDY